jgi:hypothetical protein
MGVFRVVWRTQRHQMQTNGVLSGIVVCLNLCEPNKVMEGSFGNGQSERKHVHVAVHFRIVVTSVSFDRILAVYPRLTRRSKIEGDCASYGFQKERQLHCGLPKPADA